MKYCTEITLPGSRTLVGKTVDLDSEEVDTYTTGMIELITKGGSISIETCEGDICLIPPRLVEQCVVALVRVEDNPLEKEDNDG